MRVCVCMDGSGLADESGTEHWGLGSSDDGVILRQGGRRGGGVLGMMDLHTGWLSFVSERVQE